MRRPRLLVLPFALLPLLGLAATAGAQQAKPLPRVGVLCAVSCGNSGFSDRELGWVDGTTITFERREAKGDVQRLHEQARELVQLNVDVIVPVARVEFLAALQATKTIPIAVISLGGDLVREGFAQSLARPGGNVTGSMASVPNLYQKQWQFLKEIVPGVTTVAVLFDANANTPLDSIEAFAKSMGLRVVRLPIRTADDLDEAFVAARRHGADGLWINQSGLLYTHRRRIADLALQARLPSAAQFSEWAATYVDRVLRGAKVGDLPIEQPTKFDLVVNRKTAKALGITIPAAFELRVNRLID